MAQRRRRVFLVGHLGDGRAAEVLFEPESCAGDSAPRRETGEGFAAAITERTRDAGRTLEMQEDLAYALTKPGSGGRPHSRLIAFSESGPGYWRDGMGSLRERHANEGAMVCFEPRYYTRDNKTGGAPQGAVNLTNAHKAGDSAPHIAALRQNLQGDVYMSEEMPPLRSGATGGMNQPTVQNSCGIRRLTPTECERLQGFPDGFTAGQSDTTRYRQLGNAVCVPVAEWIGRRIVKAKV